MAVHDFKSQRLHVDAPLSAGQRIDCTPDQSNYLLNVLRMGEGAAILVFNGRDGEWRATLAREGKRHAALVLSEQVREQQGGPDVEYLFAPLKRSRLDYMVQKATELGVARLRPVITRHTIAERVNTDRMRANVIEAAEQCGILRVPEIDAPLPLERVISGWDQGRRLVFCDEAAEERDAIAALRRPFEGATGPPAVGVLVGPEGGFSDNERNLVRSQPFTIAISLGPRIMRADTAAVAALALVNAAIGDWR